MNIVLIGFMGVGKSAVAKRLAERTGYQLVELDELVVERSGRSSVSEIMEKDGEIAFREAEIAVAKEISQRGNQIVATGGGVVINRIILDYFSKHGKVIFLQTRFTEILKRIDLLGDRPLFKDKKKAKELFDFREVLYKEYADLSVVTDNRTIAEVVESIVSMLKLKA